MRKLIIVGIARFLIFCFWTMCIAFFLLLPTFTSYFTTNRSLTIFTWPLLLDPLYLKQFEQESGIKIHLAYFESGSALLSKMEATKGRGYDLIIPDDRTLQVLIEQGLVKKIDKTKLSFWADILPELLNTYADPNNEYSIPYYWGIYGIGYDSKIYDVKDLANTWGLLFDKNPFCNTRVCMTDDPREAIMITAQFLFGTIDALKDKQTHTLVKEALIKQKKQVEVYTILRSDSLVQNRSCGFAVIMSPDVWRLWKEHPSIQMLVPREGSFVIIDSMAIPHVSSKDEMIYEFLNFLYRKEVIKHHIENFGFCSPLSTVVIPDQELFCPIEHFKSFDFFRNVISDEEINELWIEVLAA